MTQMEEQRTMLNGLPIAQFVRFQINIKGPDGIEVQYPYGWVIVNKLVTLETAAERMDYLLGFTEVHDDVVVFNGDTVVPRGDILNGTFEVIGESQIYDFSNGKEYFSDASFGKLVEWCKEYDRKIGANSFDDEERNPD